MTEFRGAAKRRTTGGQSLDTEPLGQEEDKAQPQSPATESTEFRGAAKRRTRPSHRVDRAWEDKAWTQSPATELRVRAAKRRRRGGAAVPGRRVDRVQDAAKRRTRPSHRAQPQS